MSLNPTPVDKQPPTVAAPASLQALIFDMDGVLCDTMPYHLRAWAEYVAANPELANLRTERLAQMGGKRNQELLEELLDRPPSPEEVRHWGSGKEAVYRSLIRNEITWMPGLVNFLNAARAAGLKIGLATSACRENLELLMAQDNIGEFFTVKVMEEDVQRGKPDPQCYLLAAERLGIAPQNCLVFEDAVAGVQAAIAAGMSCWGVLTTHTQDELGAVGASVCLQDFNDLRVTALLPTAFRQEGWGER